MNSNPVTTVSCLWYTSSTTKKGVKTTLDIVRMLPSRHRKNAHGPYIALFHQRRLQSLAFYGSPVDSSTEYDFLCDILPFVRSYDIREIILGITMTVSVVSGFIANFGNNIRQLDTILSDPQFARLERVEFINDAHNIPSPGSQHFTLEDMQRLLPSLAARNIVFVSTAPWKDGSIRQPGRFA